MRNIVKVLGIFLVSASACTANENLYGVSWGNSNNGNDLYQLRTTTGSGFRVENLNVADLVFANSMASRDRESLFTVAIDTTNFPTRTLVRINPTVSPPEFHVGPTIDVSGLDVSSSMDGLAYHDDYGLMGVDINDKLVRIDIDTGKVELIRRVVGLQGPIGIQGLAFSADGWLYGWGVERHGLIRINPANAFATRIGGFPSGDIQALEFSPSGTLYGARDQLFRINTRTGGRSVIGSGAGFSDIRGLAFATGVPVPEPSSVLVCCTTVCLFFALYRSRVLPLP